MSEVVQMENETDLTTDTLRPMDVTIEMVVLFEKPDDYPLGCVVQRWYQTGSTAIVRGKKFYFLDEPGVGSRQLAQEWIERFFPNKRLSSNGSLNHGASGLEFYT